MPKKFYEILEHTADIRIRVKAKQLKTLFSQTARAMFNIIAKKKLVIPSLTGGAALEKIIIKQKAGDLEELFINWLNDLLSLSAIKKRIFCDFKFKKLDERDLEAEAFGQDIKDYRVNTEIKAATYHQLKLEQAKDGWQVEVIFDV